MSFDRELDNTLGRRLPRAFVMAKPRGAVSGRLALLPYLGESHLFTSDNGSLKVLPRKTPLGISAPEGRALRDNSTVPKKSGRSVTP